MKFRLFFLALIFIFRMGPDFQAGEIYQWIDKDGVQHFTNLPPPPGAQIVEGLSETQSYEPPADTRPTNREDTGAGRAGVNNSTDGGDTGAVESGDRRFRKWKNSRKDREEKGAVEGGEKVPTDRDDPGSDKDGEKNPTDSEDPGSFESSDRRFPKWKNESTDREETGPVKGGENKPTNREIF